MKAQASAPSHLHFSNYSAGDVISALQRLADKDRSVLYKLKLAQERKRFMEMD